MSLSSFVVRREVIDKLKPLRPKLPRKIPAPLQIKSRSNRSAMVGTAFDYLLRFELQRRAPHAVAEPWVAEYVPDLLWRAFGMGAGDRARAFVGNAKAALAAHLKNKEPTRSQLTELAAHTIRLASFDEVYRARPFKRLIAGGV